MHAPAITMNTLVTTKRKAGIVAMIKYIIFQGVK